jgi:hypothetical protein
MKIVLNAFLVIILILSSVICVLEDIKLDDLVNSENLFKKALRFTSEINFNITKIAEELMFLNSDKDFKKNLVKPYNEKLKEVFGDLDLFLNNQFMKNSQFKNFDFFDKFESVIVFRNIIISIAYDEIFNNLKYKLPYVVKFSEEVNKSIDFTKKNYLLIRDIVNNIFDKADINKNGLISTYEFLNIFPFEKNFYLDQIIDTQNPKGVEKINKLKAFDIFLLIIFKQHEIFYRNSLNIKARETVQNVNTNEKFLSSQPNSVKKFHKTLILYDQIEAAVEERELNKKN